MEIDLIYNTLQKVNRQIDGHLISFSMGGSRLYGTSTASSDYDFKGVFMPSRESILTGRIGKATRIKDTYNGIEVDSEIFSLHKFIRLACEGQTVVFDMLHTPKEYTYYSTNMWKELIANRERFYSKNIKSFIGYAKAQATKYLVKIDKYDELKNLYIYLKRTYDLLYTEFPNVTMGYVWNDIIRGLYIKDADINPQGIEQINICGRIYPKTAKISYVLNSIEETLSKYGNRTKNGVASGNTDWKSFYHAIRVVGEISELFSFGTITLPCPDHRMLSRVRQGEYTLDELANLLNTRIQSVDKLKENSNLPEKVNYKYWDKWLIEKVYNYIIRL